MLKGKLIAGLILSIVILMGCLGGAVKFYFSERDSRIIAELAATQNEQALVSYSNSIEDHIEYYSTEINHLAIKFDSARSESDKFQRKLAEYDLEKAARNDPEKLENSVNKATADLFYAIEVASGR